MKSRSLWATVALSASLLVPLAGCGAVEEPSEVVSPEVQAPPEAPSAPQARSDASEQDASAETVARLGVSRWRMSDYEGRTVRVEGVSARGQVVLSARLTLDFSEEKPLSYLIDLDTPVKARVRVDSGLEVLEGDASHEAYQALRRDVLAPREEPVGPEGLLDVSDFNLPAELERSASRSSGEVQTFASEATRNAWRRRLICELNFAQEAYKSVDGRANVCAYGYQRDISRDVMKVWRYSNRNTKTVYIAVGFAGTRFPDPGDILRDLQSEFYVDHSSPLSPTTASPTMRVGRGWEARWRTQATTANRGEVNFATWLGAEAWSARIGGYKLHVTVSGHSLGAVTATLAGFDIAGFLGASGTSHHVSVVAFNPPRLGAPSARDAYQGRLFGSGCARSDFRSDRPCLTLRQMTRSGDPVQSVPVDPIWGYHHPVWQSTPNARGVGGGAYGNRELPYCAQNNASSRGFALANHDLDSWAADIYRISGTHLDCMFRDP
jgi:hypothetical protein